MPELRENDSVVITNPTSEDFTWSFNGEPYTIRAGESKGFGKFTAFHLAKHLSSKMIDVDFQVKIAKIKDKDLKRQAMGELSQSMVFDGPKRRIALYKILKDTHVVEQVIKSYPFKGWIGEMDEYKKFVESQEVSTAEKAA